MEARIGTIPAIGILVACITAVLLPIGCQSTDRVVTTEACETCPICEKETRVQPITGLKYTTCVCPTCREVLPVNEDMARELERFIGGPVSGTVQVCGNCDAVVAECAVCRQNRADEAAGS